MSGSTTTKLAVLALSAVLVPSEDVASAIDASQRCAGVCVNVCIGGRAFVESPACTGDQKCFVTTP